MYFCLVVTISFKDIDKIDHATRLVVITFMFFAAYLMSLVIIL